jgi:hypothetical protein
MEDILTFAEKISEDPDHPWKMREYAVEHLDWSIKMRVLKRFLENLL